MRRREVVCTSGVFNRTNHRRPGIGGYRSAGDIRCSTGARDGRRRARHFFCRPLVRRLAARRRSAASVRQDRRRRRFRVVRQHTASSSRNSIIAIVGPRVVYVQQQRRRRQQKRRVYGPSPGRVRRSLNRTAVGVRKNPEPSAADRVGRDDESVTNRKPSVPREFVRGRDVTASAVDDDDDGRRRRRPS